MSANMELMPVLSIHAVCTNIDGYGKVEYYREEDVADFINRVKDVIPNVEYPDTDKDGNRIYTFLHDRINRLAGQRLITYNVQEKKDGL